MSVYAETSRLRTVSAAWNDSCDFCIATIASSRPTDSTPIWNCACRRDDCCWASLTDLSALSIASAKPGAAGPDGPLAGVAPVARARASASSSGVVSRVSIGNASGRRVAGGVHTVVPVLARARAK